MNKQNNSGYLITPGGDLKEGSNSNNCSNTVLGFATHSEGINDSAKDMASRWKDWCYKRTEDKKTSSKGKKLKRTYFGESLGGSLIKYCEKNDDGKRVALQTNWDFRPSYNLGYGLHDYLESDCRGGSNKIQDDWNAWGGIYPHTSPNLVGYGADGRWGSEDNQYTLLKDTRYENDIAKRPIPQEIKNNNLYFHTMSPLSIMGVKTYIDLKDTPSLGDNFRNDTEVKDDSSKGDLLTTTGDNNITEYRPRHVQTSMTSCTYNSDNDEGKGNFPELRRNKLFFETDQKSTSLYPSELSSKTNIKSVTRNQIYGEESEIGRGGILRGCSRRQNDYDASNLLHCCIMGKPISGKNKLRADIQNTCPSKYCRNLVPYDTLTQPEKNFAKSSDLDSCGQMNGPIIGTTKVCYKMTESCKNLGKKVCNEPITGNETLEELCEAWETIQQADGNKMKRNRCTWFVGNQQVNNLFKKKISSDGKYIPLTSAELKLVKKLYDTFNNTRCQETISSMISGASTELNMKNFCKGTVEEAYGKCLPRDKSSPHPKKVKSSPSPDEIKTCQAKKDDPNECEKSKDCIFQFRGEDGTEYKKGDPGVVKYYRKTYKGSLLSSDIEHYDNNFRGKELVDDLQKNNIHVIDGEEGIGKNICACYHQNNKNNYNAWYKRNKLIYVKKDANIEHITRGRDPDCWISECAYSPFVDLNKLERTCKNVFVCLQMANTKIKLSGGMTRQLENETKQGCTIDSSKNTINQNMGDEAVNLAKEDPDFSKNLLSFQNTFYDTTTNTNNTIDGIKPENTKDGNMNLLLIGLGSVIGVIIILLIIKHYQNDD